MKTVLDLLEYESLARIWIERTKRGPRRAAHGHLIDVQSHVVRSTESDTIYENTIDHLSESECEVIG